MYLDVQAARQASWQWMLQELGLALACSSAGGRRKCARVQQTCWVVQAPVVSQLLRVGGKFCPMLQGSVLGCQSCLLWC